MPTPPALIKAVSESTGVELGTLTEIDRWLVRGKLRPVGGRGPNAAKMGPPEAARLLTAVLASPQSNEAADAVLRYAQTRPDKERSSKLLFSKAGLDDLALLASKHSFVDGLAALIASAGNGSLAKLSSPKHTPQIEVYAFTRAILGRIRVSGLPNGSTASIEYMSALGTAGRGRSYNNILGDLEESRRITERTIYAVAGLFK